MAYKEYRRPSIDLDARPKEWKERPACTLKEGFLVAERGKITGVTEYALGIRITYLSGQTQFFEPSDMIYSLN